MSCRRAAPTHHYDSGTEIHSGRSGDDPSRRRYRSSVRLIDCVGYMVKGASGQFEDGVERMVTTPWFDKEISLTEAAEQGTYKVIAEHSTIGLVVTCDGTICEIPP